MTKNAVRRWPFYGPDVEGPILERIRSGNLSALRVDPAIEELELEFVQRLAPGSSAVFCGTGTAALSSAYFALRLTRGAEVLVPTATFRATVTPLLLLGLVPVLCDCDHTTGCIDLRDAAARVGPRTEAIVVTHQWGHTVDMPAARHLAERYHLALVEDCSHAHGASVAGKPVGTWGDVGAFSLGGTKMVSGGLGGMLITSDPAIYDRAVLYGQPKHRARVQISEPGLRGLTGTGLGANLRGSPIAAILALDHLRRLRSTIAIKNKNLELLARVIRDSASALQVPTLPADHGGTFYKFICGWRGNAHGRERAFSALAAQGIELSRPDTPLHREPLFREPATVPFFEQGRLACQSEEFPGAEALFASGLVWDTLELYEPARELVAGYGVALRELAELTLAALESARSPVEGHAS